jgi:subtilase family serine protease
MWRGTHVIRSRRTFLACLLAGGTALGALTAASSSQAAPGGAAATRPMTVAGSAAPALPAGTTRIGVLPAGQQLTVDVALNLRDQAALTALLNGLADPDSPYYHHFLAPGQFAAAFGPTDAEVAQVESALRAAGLTPGPAAADHLSIPVTATAARLQQAFGITLATYREPDGRVAYANTAAPKVAGNVVGIVQGVLGLDNLQEYHAMSAATPLAARTAKTASNIRALKQAFAARPALASAGPKACSTAGVASFALPLDFIGGFYGFGQLWNQGDLGAGQKIAVVELTPDSASDIAAFEKCYGVSAPVKYIKVDNGAGTGSGNGVATADIEILAALAPKATIDVYQGPRNGTGLSDGFYHIIQKFVSSDTEKVLADSWVGCEAGEAAAKNGNLQALENRFSEANAQGQTVLVTAGNSGSTGCFGLGYNSKFNTTVNPAFPASSPFVTSVGGTTILTDGKNVLQGVWNESADKTGATGGGPSTVPWCMAPYQYQTSIPGLVTTKSATMNTKCSALGHHVRETPDVSANADWDSGYGVFFKGAWTGWGGTGTAADVWAAYAALTNASSYCKNVGPVGVLPQVLYSVAAKSYKSGTVFDDIVPVDQLVPDSGWPTSNAYTPSGYKGTSYPVTSGYDLTTGLGTLSIWGSAPSPSALTYAVLACRQVAVTHVSLFDISSAATRPVPVIVTGVGFSSTPSKDKVGIFRGATLLKTLTPSKASTTALAVSLPAEAPGIVDVRVSVNGGPYSLAGGGDNVQYLAPPKVSSISPTTGSHNGGTKITIHGSNFMAAGRPVIKSVMFYVLSNGQLIGGKAGTKLAVSSSGVLTVVTPAHAKGQVWVFVLNQAGDASVGSKYTYT